MCTHPCFTTKQQVVHIEITAQEKTKLWKETSRSSKTTTSSRCGLAATPSQLPVKALSLLTSHLVKSLVGLWYINSRCLWWGSWNISLDFKSSNSKSISQTKYIQYILKKFEMKNGKPIKTPMGTNEHLDLDTGGKSVDQKVYRSMTSSLLYLCAYRPNIILSVCMCARF
jgi:hypothetical protein